MVFKRRDARSWPRVIAEFFWPKGGWKRAASYVIHRLRRLPDAPERIARGIAAGVYVSFTPLFGLHFLSAALIAFVMRGNILAALLATFVGNPITFPLFATASLETGYWLLGSEFRMPLSEVMPTFGHVTVQLWANINALFNADVVHWDSVIRFFRGVWLPYLVGSIVPGTITSIAFYYASLPLIKAYQKLRTKRRAEQSEKRQSARVRALARAEAADWAELREDIPPGAEGDADPKRP